ncbi:MAG TPA: AAA family ATPase [Geobacteraceae bacterium]|nr:AAA family ATPase [Geobacteraceae bacterium]
MAVLKKTVKGPDSEAEPVSVKKGLKRQAHSGPEDVSLADGLPDAHPPIIEEQGALAGRRSFPLTAGLRPLKFIRKTCANIPSFIRPSIRLKKEDGKTGTPKREIAADPFLVEQQPAPVYIQPVFEGTEPATPAKEHVAMEVKPAPIEQQAAEERRPVREASPARPLDHEKMGYVSPAYTISRSVTLNPQVMVANRCVGFQHDSPELEYYKVLRTRILQRSKGGGSTVMVTSAFPGEGKTLTAINLAFTFAKEYRQTALLVDCDLKRQQVHKVLGFPSEKGLADYLLDDCSVRDLFVWPGVEKLSVISGGKTVVDSSELLGSPGMKNLVAEMKGRYPDRYVFFDVPPLLTSADPLAFAPYVDYIIVAVQAGRTPLPDVNRALSLLPAEKVLGLVLNRQQEMPKPYESKPLAAGSQQI